MPIFNWQTGVVIGFAKIYFLEPLPKSIIIANSNYQTNYNMLSKEMYIDFNFSNYKRIVKDY